MRKWRYIIWAVAIIVLGLVFLDGCVGEEKNLSGTVSADSYEMDLQLDTEQKVLTGTVEMAFTNRTDGSLESIVVRNYPASILKELKKGSAEISAVTAEDGTPLSFSAGKDPSVVTVELGGEGLSPDESAVVRVSYKTDIPKVRERFGVYTEGKDEYYLLTFCFPSLSVFEDGKWNDSPYIFGAESTYSKVCDYKVCFEAPKDFLVAASGEETTKDGVTEIEGKNMRDMSIIASNHMEVQTDTASGIRINNYTFRHPGYSWMDTYNELTMESAKESVTMFTELFGKYPYEELDVIQCADFGGMEYPGLILIGLPDVDPTKGLMKGMEGMEGNPQLCLLVAHETAHQWFYAVVGNDQYTEPWLDESFANYCENGIYGLARPPALKRAIEIAEKETGQEVYLWWDSEEDVSEMLTEKPSKINKPYEAYSPDDHYDYDMAVYEQGAQFFFELRRAMGDDKFFAMMREYYKTYCLKEATGKDFIDMIYKYDASEKVKSVMERYIA